MTRNIRTRPTTPEYRENMQRIIDAKNAAKYRRAVISRQDENYHPREVDWDELRVGDSFKIIEGDGTIGDTVFQVKSFPEPRDEETMPIMCERVYQMQGTEDTEDFGLLMRTGEGK